MLFNQLKNGFLWNSNFWKIIFYAFQILKRKFLCFSPTWKSYFMVFSLHFRVLNLYFWVFFWQHQHHQQRNENDFSTWVSLSILLLCSVYHIFHKRNENEFSTWVSLGIFMLWSVNHSFGYSLGSDQPPYSGQNIFMCLLHVLEHSKHF